jgi:hypothetical protein
MYRHTKIGRPLLGPWLKAWKEIYVNYLKNITTELKHFEHPECKIKISRGWDGWCGLVPWWIRKYTNLMVPINILVNVPLYTLQLLRNHQA